MVDRLVAVDDANYRLPEPVLAALAGEISDPETALSAAVAEAAAVGSDVTVADLATDPTSETAAAIDAKWLGRPEYEALLGGLAAGFRPNSAMWAYGHSFVIGQGLSVPYYYVTKSAAAFDMTLTNRGVGGAKAEEACWRMTGGTGAFPIGTSATLLFQLMMNSMRLNGIDTPTATGVEWSWRTMSTFASAAAGYAHNSGRFTYTGTWTPATDSTYYGGGYRSGSVGGSYFEFTTATPANETSVLLLARKVGLSGAVTEIRRMDTDTVLMTFDNQNQAAAGIVQNYVPAAITLDVPSGTTVRVSVISGTTTLLGLIERSATPNPIIAVKEPKLWNWAASTSYPNGSDAGADYYNAIIDEVAQDFPNMIVVDPEPSWTKGNSASLVQSDQVHPNIEGNERLQLAVVQATSKATLKALSALAWA